ncbi:hypothetical protein CSKR_100796 [Clonorchis sinensis]|uniref:Uncharacterized protein n=1 Tax=Clonorchis sinensis TaxID=79923 RepID=A0A3R7DB73_CLOSI|nr:hypothetical protein CSKR_100796 [Clonorchis sinensis]
MKPCTGVLEFVLGANIPCATLMVVLTPVSIYDVDYEASSMYGNVIHWQTTAFHRHSCARFRSPQLHIITARPVPICDADYEASPLHGNLIPWTTTSRHSNNVFVVVHLACR